MANECLKRNRIGATVVAAILSSIYCHKIILRLPSMGRGIYNSYNSPLSVRQLIAAYDVALTAESGI